jgi:hypothetical protein
MVSLFFSSSHFVDGLPWMSIQVSIIFFLEEYNGRNEAICFVPSGLIPAGDEYATLSP